jgi:DNA-directed RNA polymerase specialized sigma24 family protein
VRAEVERLPADMREVIILCEWQDLSAAEAAVILDTTPKAVDNRLYRARNLLRERLKRWL